MSYLEIYNERLQDLLHAEDDAGGPGRPKLDLRVHPKVGVYVRNLTEAPVVRARESSVRMRTFR